MLANYRTVAVHQAEALLLGRHHSVVRVVLRCAVRRNRPQRHRSLRPWARVRFIYSTSAAQIAQGRSYLPMSMGTFDWAGKRPRRRSATPTPTASAAPASAAPATSAPAPLAPVRRRYAAPRLPTACHNDVGHRFPVCARVCNGSLLRLRTVPRQHHVHGRPHVRHDLRARLHVQRRQLRRYVARHPHPHCLPVVLASTIPCVPFPPSAPNRPASCIPR